MSNNLTTIEIDTSEALVPVGEADLDFLRRGKNSNRKSFFFKAVITRSDQRAWFRSYQSTDAEHMFIIYSNSKRVGVVGLRLLGNSRGELYNVMRVGERTSETRGLMSRALNSLMQHYKLTHGIDEFIADVVRGNEALKWYLRNGFQVLSERDDALQVGRLWSTGDG